MALTNHAWHLQRRPQGVFQPDDFAWHASPVPDLEEGQVCLRTMLLSCDPTQRVWAQTDSYLPAVKIGAVMRSFGLGIVVQSKHDRYQPGDLLVGLTGWQRYCVTDTRGFQQIHPLPDVPLGAFLGPLGMTGITAYFGLLDIGKPKEGETLVVSGAAGAVGSIVCQIGKIKGCRVVGIAGTDEKCAWLTDTLGIDAAINYKTQHVYRQLRRHCPDGVDIYFENVGGPILDMVLPHLNIGARIPLCGYIAQYAATTPVPGIQNLAVLVSKRARIEGFLVLDYLPRALEAVQDLVQWMHAGKLHYQLDVQEGLEHAPATINRLFDGRNTGKLLIEVPEVTP